MSEEWASYLHQDGRNFRRCTVPWRVSAVKQESDPCHWHPSRRQTDALGTADPVASSRGKYSINHIIIITLYITYYQVFITYYSYYLFKFLLFILFIHIIVIIQFFLNINVIITYYL